MMELERDGEMRKKRERLVVKIPMAWQLRTKAAPPNFLKIKSFPFQPASVGLLPVFVLLLHVAAQWCLLGLDAGLNSQKITST